LFIRVQPFHVKALRAWERRPLSAREVSDIAEVAEAVLAAWEKKTPAVLRKLAVRADRLCKERQRDPRARDAVQRCLNAFGVALRRLH
jgi:hypothetical protein